MNELLDKLSSYNLFNYLLPGALFAAFLPQVAPYSIIQEHLVIGFFVYYFVGLVVSRIGSVVLEPILRKTRIIVFADYVEFLDASTVDSKIEILSEANNTYRTIVSLALCLLLVRLYHILSVTSPFLETYRIYVALGFLTLLFLAAYRKQTAYITKRIKRHSKAHA